MDALGHGCVARPPRQRGPVAETATHPRKNPQWTDYRAPEASTERREEQRQEKRLKRKEKSAPPPDEDEL